VQVAIDFCAVKGIPGPVINSKKIIMTAQIVMQAEDQHTGFASSRDATSFL